MLITERLVPAALAISAARSITLVLETFPDRTVASSLVLTSMRSPGNSACSCCCSAATGCSTTRLYWVRREAPHTIRLIVPAALPSIRISRGATTVASATAGLVKAIRVTSKSVVSTVERPAVTMIRAIAGCDCAAGGGGAACPAALSCARPLTPEVIVRAAMAPAST